MSLLEKPVAEKRYLCYVEVHDLYGIGRKILTKLVRERRLRRAMVGKAWRYSVADLEAVFCPDTRISHRRHSRCE